MNKRHAVLSGLFIGLFVPVAVGAMVALPTCPTPLRSLSRGATGPDVTSLQQFLVVQHELSADSITGLFGPGTEAALQRWQKNITSL